MAEKCVECGKFVSDAGLCPVCQAKEDSTKKAVLGTKMTDSFQGKIKLPNFSADNVTLWWAQVETRLSFCGVKTEIAKYQYVISALPMEVARRVPDLITATPAENPYSTLKERVCNEFEPTSSAKLKKLLEGCELGDRKPSTLLREMRQLSNGRVSDDVLRELFFKRLPDFVETILLTTGVTDLDKAAEAADKVHEKNSTPKIETMSKVLEPSKPANQPSADFLTLTEAVSRLAREVAQISNRSRPRSRSRSGRRERDSSRSRSKKFDTCYYHHKFGEKATHCRHWCKFHAEFEKKSENK
jgi:hypothetical protein